MIEPWVLNLLLLRKQYWPKMIKMFCGISVSENSHVIILFLFSILSCLFVQAFGSSQLYVYVLLSFLFVVSFLQGDIILAIAILVIVFKPLILVDIYQPLGSLDAYNYYYYAFESDNTRSFYEIIKSFIVYGDFSILELTAVLYKILAFIFGSNEPIVLVYANYLMVFWSSRILGKLLGLRASHRSLFTLFISLSPLLNKYSTFLLKESMTCLLIFIACHGVVKRWNFIFIIFIMIVSTILRPYSIAFFMGILIFIGKINLQQTMSSILLLLFSLLSFFIFLDGYSGVYFLIKDVIFSFFALFLSPNFLRFDNWQSVFFISLESLILSICVIFYFINVDCISRKYLLSTMVVFSLVLGGVSHNRMISDTEFSNANNSSLLNDDISRKKFPFQFIMYSLPFLLLDRRVLNEF